MSSQELTDRLKAEALRLGFDAVGIAPAVPAPGYPNFLAGSEPGMRPAWSYMTRKHAASRAHPGSVLDGVSARSSSLSVVYGRNDPQPSTPLPTQGKVARYARGADYHRVLWDKLEALLAWLRGQCPDGRRAGPSPTRLRSWNAIMRGWRGWAGSARTRCSSIAAWAASPSWARS